jgi:hypothetical protein
MNPESMDTLEKEFGQAKSNLISPYLISLALAIKTVKV